MSATNRKGDIAEAAFLFEAISRGYNVCSSYKQDSAYDCVLDRKGSLERVQIKYREITEKGNLVITITQDTKTNRRDYSSENIDYFAVYVPELKQIAYIPIKLCEGKTRITLRVAETKNKQVKGINYLKDFTSW